MKTVYTNYIYKALVVLMIIIMFISFVVTMPVQAALEDKEFQYVGTSKGSYKVVKQDSFLDKLINALKELADWLLGIMTMGIRIVFVGWTALIELTLSSAVKSSLGNTTFGEEFVAGTVFGGGGVTNSAAKMERDKNIITIESIVFNRVPLLDINMFNFTIRDDVSATGTPYEDTDGDGMPNYLEEQNGTDPEDSNSF